MKLVTFIQTLFYPSFQRGVVQISWLFTSAWLRIWSFYLHSAWHFSYSFFFAACKWVGYKCYDLVYRLLPSIYSKYKIHFYVKNLPQPNFYYSSSIPLHQKALHLQLDGSKLILSHTICIFIYSSLVLKHSLIMDHSGLWIFLIFHQFSPLQV